MTRQPGWRAVVLSLGSNLGDRMAYLQLGVDVLAAGSLRSLAVSGVFETAPVGGPEQDDYLNAVLLGISAAPAREIMRLATAAEEAASRERSERWGPRTLDVDVISCDDEISVDPELTLPHPRAHERAFVLVPWLEVDADAVLPGRGTVADLLAEIGTAGVHRRGDLSLTLPAGAGVRAEAGAGADAGAGAEAEAGLPCT
jgi:2-amino-4-hydroxy-6-hydroxymethyldihydropteridine diphosphokinase